MCNIFTILLLLLQVIEKGMHSGEGIQGCSIYTGTAGIAYMFLRLAENLRHTQSLIAQHPRSAYAKLSTDCLLKRAQEYGHWAKHLSHCGSHTKVALCCFKLLHTRCNVCVQPMPLLWLVPLPLVVGQHDTCMQQQRSCSLPIISNEHILGYLLVCMVPCSPQNKYMT